MRELKMNVIETEGYAVTVEIICSSLEDYAKSFLHVVNNVRENNDILKKVKNHHNNDVTVYCVPEIKDELIRYLENFGEFKSCEKVLMYQLEESNYNINKYDDAVVVPEFD